MNMNAKEVRFGTKQEAVITPKEGYELERVDVINTVDNSAVPCELFKKSDNPAQWVCSFVQPAGHISIKPVLRPVLYSISFEVSDDCNIVLVEQDSMAEVEIKAAIEQDAVVTDEEAEASGESEDFNQPQHSLNEDTEQSLDVGEEVSTLNSDPHADETVPLGDEQEALGDIGETQETNTELSQESEVSGEDNVANAESDYEENHDIEYDAGVYSSELDEDEPVVISQKEYDKKNEIYWQWRQEYDAGRCTEKEFLDIRKRHLEFMENITAGKIVIE